MPIDQIWVYLSTTPLLGLTLTLLAYQAAFWLYSRSGMNPLANPVAIAVTIVLLVLLVTGTPYKTYFDGAQFVHFLLGPATVALAIPLYAQMARLRAMLIPLLIALIAGALTAIVSALAIGWALGAAPATVMSLAPKSVTTPIAMGITEKIGGLPSLTAVLVISTGIIGAVLARPLLNAIRVEDPAIRGFALGVAAHGIGTARAFQVSEVAGAFAALAMGLNGVATALLVPFIIAWIRAY
ncbi:MAG: LrgB family protein [Thiotrichales bacterium]